MHQRLNFTSRTFCYLILSFVYATATSNVMASDNLRTFVTSESGVDMVFNLFGALFGGFAQLCFSLNNESTYVSDIKGKALRNLFLSLFIGFIVFILTEPEGYFSVSSNLNQLGLVSLSGAFSGETMEFLRNWYKKRLTQEIQK